MPYPHHLAISDNWMIHYQTAMIPAESWKLEEERQFLDNPAGVIGWQAIAVIATIGREIDLDFAGIDFSILADGSALVFEVNATMLVYLEDEESACGFKNAYVQKITDVFDAHLVTCMHRGNFNDDTVGILAGLGPVRDHAACRCLLFELQQPVFEVIQHSVAYCCGNRVHRLQIVYLAAWDPANQDCDVIRLRDSFAQETH